MGKWIVPFTSRTGTEYTIEIEGRQGEDMTLTAASDCFVVEEDQDRNLFIPIRTQSGYISVLTDDPSLCNDIIPTEGGERRVYLRNASNTIVWYGYVQPKLQSFSLWSGTGKLSIPVECPLAAMKYISFANTSIFADIGHILADIQDTKITGVYFQGSSLFSEDSTNVRAWLRKRVFLNFLTGKSFTNYDVLSAICMFFGWTARVRGSIMYLLFMRNVDSATSQQVVYGDPGEYEEGIYYEGFDWEQSILPSRALSENASLIYEAALKNAKVTVDVDPYDYSIDLPTDDIKEAIYEGLFDTRWIDMSDETYDRGYYDSLDNVEVGDWLFSTFNVYVSLKYKEGSLDIAKATPQFMIAASPWYMQGADPQDSTLPYEPVGWYGSWLTLTSKSSLSFPGGGQLGLNPIFAESSFHSTFFMIVELGSLRYNATKSAWETISGDAGDDNKIYLQQDEDGNQETTYINMPSTAISSQLSVRMQCDSATLTDFSMEFISKESLESKYNSSLTTISHTASNDGKYAETLEMESPLGIQEHSIQSARNLLLEASGTSGFCQGLYAGPSSVCTFNPLQRLVDEAAAERNSRGEWYEMEMLQEDLANIEISPLTIFYNEHLDAMLYPVVISRNFSEDTTTLILLKRKFSGQ